MSRDDGNGRELQIVLQGGYVEIHKGAWRVHGVLSVSRSIGDAHLKDWVLAEPDSEVLLLSEDMEFLVLATDGLWEKVWTNSHIHMHGIIFKNIVFL